MPWHYRLFDLNITSDVELQGVPAGSVAKVPDVVVRLTTLPADLPSLEGDYRVGDGLLLVIDATARFLVSGGSTIDVEPAAGARPANVRLYLLGSAMGALLHQRGLVPLHANAIEVDGRAVAFAGPSGSGKSTLAAWFHDQGYPVLADDVAALDCRDGEVVLLPGLPRVRLWRGALQASGRDIRDYRPSFAGDPAYDKFDVALDRVAHEPLPVEAVYLIERGDRCEVDLLTGMAAAEAVIANSYRGEFVGQMGLTEAHLRHCLAIVRRIPIYRAVRQWDLGKADQENAWLLAHVRGAR